MSKVYKLKITSVAVLFAAATGLAHAGLLGSTVNVSAYYPSSITIYQAGPIVTVSGAIEYPMGTFTSYNPSWQIDITDTQITISDSGGAGFPYGVASFNGWILTVISGPAISSAVADGASQFNPVGISIVNGNQLLLNFSGVAGPISGTSIIDITTVPEPASLVLLGLGMVGIALLTRHP
jgi:hypothetical protein